VQWPKSARSERYVRCEDLCTFCSHFVLAVAQYHELKNAERREAVRDLTARIGAIDKVLASQSQYQSVAKQVYTLASTLIAVREAVDHAQPLSAQWARLARDARYFKDPLVQTIVQLVLCCAPSHLFILFS
jgi:hypothetical protein